MSVKFAFYPAFQDKDSLTDHVYRALWYLSPFKEKIRELVVPVKSNDLTPGEICDYLDPGLSQLLGSLPFNFRLVKNEDQLRECVSESTGVLLWSLDRMPVGGMSGKTIVKVDHQRTQHAGSFYLKIHEQFSQFQDNNLEQAQARFARIAERLKSDIGYVFGTGPGLSKALERGYDFSDGVCIACNSMVRNHELLERLKPPIITVADPIFHAGPSSYAAEFRKEVVRALDRYQADLIVPMRDYHIYRTHLPERFSDRIAAIPFMPGDAPNLDLRQRYHVTTTSNVLTLFLIPLAATFFKEVRIFGCDGRPTEANTYFWGHDKASQFNDQMGNIQKAHPAFFAIDYDDYYQTHCDRLKVWLNEVERKGIVVQNHTPSYIPALSSRNITGVPQPDKEPCVSIVMPAFNAARFLPEAILSIQRQSFVDWELLVVDDHSDDHTRTIVHDYMRKDARIRLLKTVGKGVSAARNTGIRAATGRYIGFLDSDDTMDEGSLKARVAALESGRASLVHSRVRFITDNGCDLGQGAGARRDLTFKDMHGFHTHCNTVMGAAEIIRKIEFPEGVTNGEDWWAFAKLLRSGVRSHYVAAGTSTYRMHPKSTVKTDMGRHIKALEEVVDWVYSDQTDPQFASEHRKGLLAPLKDDVKATHFVRAVVCNLVTGAHDEAEKLLQRNELVQWIDKQSDADLQQRVKTILVQHYAKPVASLGRMIPENTLRFIQNHTGAHSNSGNARLFEAICAALNEKTSALKDVVNKPVQPVNSIHSSSEPNRPFYSDFGEWLMVRSPWLYEFLKRWRRFAAQLFYKPRSISRLRYLYGHLALAVAKRSLLLFRVGQICAWIVRAALRHKATAVAILTVLGVLVGLPFLEAPAWEWRQSLWAAAGILLAATLGTVVLWEAIRRLIAAHDSAQDVDALRQDLSLRSAAFEGRITAVEISEGKLRGETLSIVAKLSDLAEMRRDLTAQLNSLEARVAARASDLTLLRDDFATLMTSFEESLAEQDTFAKASDFATLRDDFVGRMTSIEERLAEQDTFAKASDFATLRDDFVDRMASIEERLAEQDSFAKASDFAALRNGFVDLVTSATKRVQAAETALRDERNRFAALSEEVRSESESTKNLFRKEKQLSNYSNAASVRSHDRGLSESDIAHIRKTWLPIFALSCPGKQLAYLAHQICLAEERCEGRLASTIQAAVLRTLALLSLRKREVDVLEIGTLFGISAGGLYLAGRRAECRVRLTLIDPLKGYYEQSQIDPVTGVPVSRLTLTSNLKNLGISENDYRIIEHYSTDEAALRTASDRQYDYVLVDGDHSLQGVASDFELYSPLVRQGGLLLFDDYDTTDWPAIKPFVDQHVRPNSNWQWIGGDWRTAILRRKCSAAIIG